MRIRGRLDRLERVRLDQSKRAEPFLPVLTDAERLARTAQIVATEPQNDMERRCKDGVIALWERISARVDGAEVLAGGEVNNGQDRVNSPNSHVVGQFESGI